MDKATWVVRRFGQSLPSQTHCAGHFVGLSKAEVSRGAALLPSMIPTPWRIGLGREETVRIFGGRLWRL